MSALILAPASSVEPLRFIFPFAMISVDVYKRQGQLRVDDHGDPQLLPYEPDLFIIERIPHTGDGMAFGCLLYTSFTVEGVVKHVFIDGEEI